MLEVKYCLGNEGFCLLFCCYMFSGYQCCCMFSFYILHVFLLHVFEIHGMC